MKQAARAAAPRATMNLTLRSLRSSSRQGSRFMRGMSVEAPQCEATSREQGGGIALHGLRFGAGGQFHLSEWIAFFRLDAYAAGDHVGNARNVGAAAADDDLLRLLAARAGGQVELQGATDLLSHVVDEGVQHLRLVVAGQAAFLLGAAGLLHRQ